MFRPVMLRRAAASAIRRMATKPAPPRAMLVLPRPATTPRLAACRVPVRLYSSEGGLERSPIEERIMTILHGFDKVNDKANITPKAHFANDLGLDSLDIVEVVMAIEEEFSLEIPDKDADAIVSVGKAVDYILTQPDAV